MEASEASRFHNTGIAKMSNTYEMDTYEMDAFKGNSNEATSSELNTEQPPAEVTARRTSVLIERDNKTLKRLGKIPVLKVTISST